MEACAELVDDGVQRPKDVLADVILAQVFPEMLDRVQLWTVGWPGQQGHRGRDAQGQRAVPSGSIPQQEAMLFGELRGRVAKNSDMVWVSTQGRIKEQSCPSKGLTAAKP